MAMVVRSGIIVEEEGKVGGDVYRFDQCRQHIQAFPRLIEREPSEHQKEVRTWFTKCLYRYQHIITKEQKYKWYIYTFQHLQTGKKGNTYYLPPHMMFMKINIPRLKAGLPYLDDPPG